MTREVYEAMKRRISIVDGTEYHEHFGYPPGKFIVYRFDNDGLNSGIEEDSQDFIDGYVHGMETKNLWNVAQRFYTLASRFRKDFDARILA